MIHLSVINPIRVQIVPNADQFGILAIANHQVVLELFQSFGIEESKRFGCLFDHCLSQEAQSALITFIIQDEDQADDILIAFLNIIGLS